MRQPCIGLTDIIKASHTPHKPVTRSDIEAFRSKMHQYGPKAIAFNGKKAAKAYFGHDVNYGRQSETVGNSVVFVLPSTSGAAEGFWDETRWKELADYLLRANSPTDNFADRS